MGRFENIRLSRAVAIRDPASFPAACGAETDSLVLLNPNFCFPPHRVAPARLGSD